ncbi:MAG: hypothetical protein WC356_04305 [Candidatus Micrarchaeia archaeon]|jgi:hypothetical protein
MADEVTNRDLYRRIQLLEKQKDGLEKRIDELQVHLNTLEKAHNGMAMGVKSDIVAILKVLEASGIDVKAILAGKDRKKIVVVPGGVRLN